MPNECFNTDRSRNKEIRPGCFSIYRPRMLIIKVFSTYFAQLDVTLFLEPSPYTYSNKIKEIQVLYVAY